jgi:hypothetical protein
LIKTYKLLSLQLILKQVTSITVPTIMLVF